MTPAVPKKLDEIEYPSSDGKPMAETDLHRDEMFDLIAMLKERYKEQSNVYVAGNLLIYYEEGDPGSRFAPDVFVVFGVHGQRRRVYKLWKEGTAPGVVIEVTSRGTRLEDFGNKKALCALLGVEEYYLYDPEGEYLSPPIQGFSLWGNEYTRMTPFPDGSLLSRKMNVRLGLENGLITLVDEESGERLLRPAELENARQEAETKARLAEAERKKAEAERKKAEAEKRKLKVEREREKQRADDAEKELMQLREKLARLGIS